MGVDFLFAGLKNDQLEPLAVDGRRRGLERGLLRLSFQQQACLAARHRQIDFRENPRVQQRSVQFAPGVVHVITLGEGVEAVLLARMHPPRQRQRVQHPAVLADVLDRRFQPLQFVVDEPHVEVRVVDDQFRAADKLQEFRGHVLEQRLHGKKVVVDAMDLQRAGPHRPLRIHVAVERLLGKLAVDQLDATDFDDPVARLGLQARGFRIQYDLPHGRQASPARARSSPRFARASARSLPGCPACPFTQCQSTSWDWARSSSRIHKS